MAKALLILHVIAGFAALLTGFIAITTTKGKGWHIMAGRIYFWSMAGVAVTAIFLSIVRPNLFLLFISLFSFYLTWSGYRAIRWKNKTLKGVVRVVDRLIQPLLFAIGLIMITLSLITIWGIAKVKIQQGTEIILLVFGIIFVALTGRNLAVQIGWIIPNKLQWMYDHIQGMLAAYIATFTAFLVVNVTFLPMVVVWLAPTVVGTPVIAYWTRRYRRRLEGD